MNIFALSISFLVVLVTIFLIGKFAGNKLNLSKRYDRDDLSDWKKLDRGIDPTDKL